MAYKEVMDEYLRREKKYNETLNYRNNGETASFNKMDLECASGIGYSASATALADFVYGFPNGYTVSNRDEYVRNTKETIEEVIKLSDSLNEKTYFKVYLKMLDKLADISDSDFRKLVFFVTRHKRIEDKELSRKDDGFSKAQTKAVNEILELFSRTYNETSSDFHYFHVGTSKKEEQEYILRNKHRYILLRDAILNGFESTTSMSDEEFDFNMIETFSDIDEKELEMYYKKPFNTVACLTKKNKNRLGKKMSKKIIK